MKEKTGRKGGVVLELFIPFLMIGVIFGFLIAQFLIAAGILELTIGVKTKVEKPSMAGISTNSFLKLTNDYPSDNNLMRNVISMYAGSGGDEELHEVISGKKNELFADSIFTGGSGGDEVTLVIGNYEFNGGLLGDHDVIFRKAAVPGGKSEKVNMRFYSIVIG